MNEQALIIYGHYPRKVARPKAITAIQRAIMEFGYEHVLERTIEFSKRAEGRDLQFIPYPSTWFNQQRFDDDFDAVFPPERVNGNSRTPPIWAQIDALKALIEKARRAIPDVPSRWLCSKAEHDKAIAAREPFVAEKRKLSAQLEQLQRKLAEGL